MAQLTQRKRQARPLLSRGLREARRCCAVRVWMLLLLTWASVLWPSQSQANAQFPLTEALDQLAEHFNVRLIYSSALVPGDAYLDLAPKFGEDVQLALRQILQPFGLSARESASETFSIVRLPDATLRIRVVDAASEDPISGAVLFLGEQRRVSGQGGRLQFESVPAGRVEISVRARGYQTARISGVSVYPKRDRLTISMTPADELVAEVVVTPGRRSIALDDRVTSRAVSTADLVLVPSLGGDVSRVLENLPGVTAPDNSAAFNLRGGLAQDVSLVLDGFELYDPFHLAAFQSPFSTIDAGIVERIDFLTGGWTSELGDRHGGFVRLTTGAAEDSRQGEVELGNLNSRVVYGEPIRRIRGEWLASIRTWYPESFTNSIELGESGFSPHFSDAYIKVAGQYGARTRLSAHGLFATDRIEFFEKDGNEAVDAKSESGYLWFRWLYAARSNWDIDTVLSIGRLERQRDGLSEPEDDPFSVRDSRRVGLYGLRSDFSKQFGESGLLRAGIDTRWLDARYDYQLMAPDGAEQRFAERPSGTSAGAYATFRSRWSDAVTSELGLRWDRQSYTAETQWSPRANLVWEIDSKTVVRIGGGLYHQSQRIHELRVEDGERNFLPAERSRQLELTLSRTLPRGLNIRLDLYDRELSRLRPRFENRFNPVELFPETESDRLTIAPDSARLRGVELFLQSPANARLRWWVGYGAASARDRIGGESFPRNWDQPHSGRFLLAYRVQDRWTVSLTGEGRTGWPTTPVGAEVVVEDAEPTAQVVLGKRNSQRFPTYFRLDLRLTRRYEFDAGALRFDIQVRNLTDRTNVCCVDEADAQLVGPSQAAPILELRSWLGATPSFGIAWEF